MGWEKRNGTPSGHLICHGTKRLVESCPAHSKSAAQKRTRGRPAAHPAMPEPFRDTPPASLRALSAQTFPVASCQGLLGLTQIPPLCGLIGETLHLIVAGHY